MPRTPSRPLEDAAPTTPAATPHPQTEPAIIQRARETLALGPEWRLRAASSPAPDMDFPRPLGATPRGPRLVQPGAPLSDFVASDSLSGHLANALTVVSLMAQIGEPLSAADRATIRRRALAALVILAEMETA